MGDNTTILNKQEKQWILQSRYTRISDNKQVQIYPMGAERYLSSVLFGNQDGRYDIRADIEGKDVLVIPGYGSSGFLFAQAGAKSVTVYDKDPVTIAWVKAFKKYYHYTASSQQPAASSQQPAVYPSIGDLLTALTCWYPPLIALPTGKHKNIFLWAVNPKALRRTYIYYMLSLIRHAVSSSVQGDFELNKNLQFHVGEINHSRLNKSKRVFDTAYVPYLLGVRNGIENERDIINFIKKMTELVPTGSILVTPARNTKEFKFIGKRYFVTTGQSNIQSIVGLAPLVMENDQHWFKTQGLVVFGNSQS